MQAAVKTRPLSIRFVHKAEHGYDFPLEPRTKTAAISNTKVTHNFVLERTVFLLNMAAAIGQLIITKWNEPRRRHVHQKTRI
jgi:hypothetical protein